MINVLVSIYMICLYITIGYACYYAILYLVGLLPHKQRYKIVKDKLKFCIFVPCHNEGPVIGATVENYRNITYNKDLFDIYFIADNCTDNTADEIRKAIQATNRTKKDNFSILERSVNDPKKKGKPHALRWAIDKLEKDDAFYSKYDMFMILDADNFVDADILTHINSQYLSYKEKKRPAMIQTYLDSKNNETIISRGYYTSYRISNGFFQLPKHRLNLVPAIGGTGFAMDINFLKEIGGYNCNSLTEDLEIQTIATLKCKNIAYNGNVRIYDEKPTGLKQAIVQKTRWAQGFWYNFFKYLIPLTISLFNIKQIGFFFKKIDMLLYLSVKLIVLLGVIASTLSSVLFLFGALPQMPTPFSYLSIGLSIVTILMIPIASLYDGTKAEKKKILLHFIPNVIAMAVLSIIEIITAIIGLFKCGNQTTWKKTTHKLTSVTIDEEVSKEVVDKVVNKEKKKFAQ